MKKRILSIFLACTLSVSLFAGCGAKKADDESKETEQKQEETADSDESEESEVVSEEINWNEIVNAYKDYVSKAELNAEGYEYNFIYVNEDAIPDLVVCRTDVDKDWIYLLIYQDGEVHETSIYGDALFYNEGESSIYYHTYGGTYEALVHREVFAELTDYEWVEEKVGEYTENTLEGGISGYMINGKECAEKAYKAHFTSTGMKLAWENLYLSVDEAFEALGVE